LKNNNLHIKNDENGLYVFNYHTGLIYFVVSSEKEKIINWLENGNSSQIEDVYLNSIGAGWFTSILNSTHTQILPSIEDWENEFPEFPLTINWFLTGACPLDCLYCYAEDLMRNRKITKNSRIEKVKNPTLNEIVKTSKNILNLEPLVVVITGGDPLMSPHLKEAINLLYRKVGILIDTSGYLFNEEIAEFCKEKNVGIRISLDSNDWQINNSQRPLMNKKHQRKRESIEKELNTIKLCLDKNIPIIIQTVLTNKNYKSMFSFGDFLFNLGVRIWRIQKVQEPSRNIIKEGFESLKLEQSENFSYPNFKQLLRKHNYKNWDNSMALKFTENSNNSKNSVILVSPDGEFYTEGINDSGKFLIDKENPRKPSKKSILKFINNSGHLVRYLNLEI